MFLETKRDGETTTKPDIYALPTLIAWLETMPIDEEYNWNNCQGACLIGQYMAAQGIGWYEKLNGRSDAYSAFCDLTHVDWSPIALRRPWTFGAALARAKALHAEGAED